MISVAYCIYSNKRGGVYEIFRDSSAAFIYNPNNGRVTDHFNLKNRNVFQLLS